MVVTAALVGARVISTIIDQNEVHRAKEKVMGELKDKMRRTSWGLQPIF